MSAGDASAPALQPEEAARAALYGLIARLFYGPPDQAVLAQILNADAIEGEDALALAWRELAEACRSAFPVLLEQEHTTLFIGTGKSEVTPYLTHYVVQFATNAPLIELRQQLQRWGIGRKTSASEPEDHVAGVLEAMRYAIAVQHRTLEEQRDFFERFVHRGAIAFCDAVSASPKANFYRRVARFARDFLELESEAFRML